MNSLRSAKENSPPTEFGDVHGSESDNDSRFSLSSRSMVRRYRGVLVSLLLASCSAGLVYSGFYNGWITFQYGLGFLLTSLVYIGITIAVALAVVDRWAADRWWAKIILLLWPGLALVVLFCWVVHQTNAGFFFRPSPYLLDYLIVASMFSGAAGVWLMLRATCVESYRTKIIPRGWVRWDWVPYALLLFMAVSMGWFLIYVLDWTVGLGLYLSGREAVVDGLFTVVGAVGFLIHTLVAIWLGFRIFHTKG